MYMSKAKSGQLAENQLEAKTPQPVDRPAQHEVDSTPEAQGVPSLYFGLTAVLTAVFLYLCLFVRGWIPLWLSGDQTIFLLNAERMLHGQAIYRDFFEFTLPGTEYVYLAFFKIFGARAWIPNFFLVALGAGLTTCVVFISGKVLRRRDVALPALLFLVCAYHAMLNATHHWFSLLAMMAAIAVVMEARSIPRVAFAGVFSGLAALFTHAQGLMCVLGLACFLMWERDGDRKGGAQGKGGATLRKQIALFSAFCATLAVTCAHAFYEAGLGNVWRSVVVFTLRYYSTDVKANTPVVYLGLPAVPPWTHVPVLIVWLFIYAVVPFAYVAFLVRYWRRKPGGENAPWHRLMLLNIVGLFLFLGIASAPSIIRLAAMAPPALILLVWMVDSSGWRSRIPIALLWAFGLTLAIAEPVATQLHRRWVANLPAGQMAFQGEEQRDKYAWLAARTRPTDYILDAASLPRIYFPLGLRNPAAVPFLTITNYTRPEQVADAVAALEHKPVELVVWSPYLKPLDDSDDPADHLNPVRDYLRDHYHPIKIFPDGDSVLAKN